MTEEKKSRSERAEERLLQSLGELKTPLPEVYVVKTKIARKTLLVYVPLLVAAVLFTALFVNWSFGLVGFEILNSNELLSKISDPRSDTKRSAAVDWAGQLIESSSRFDEFKRDKDLKKLEAITPNLAQTEQVARIVESLSGPNVSGTQIDPQWGSGLMVILSFAKNKELARNTLMAFLNTKPLDQNTDLQFYALMGLARVGFEGAVPESPWLENLWKLFESRAQSSDSSVKKALALLMGQASAVPDFESKALPVLLHLLEDSNDDVRLNSAVSLFRAQRPEGRLIMNALIAEIDAIDSNKVSVNLVERGLSGIRALSQSSSPDDQQWIKKWAHSHPNFKLRDLSKKLLKSDSK